MTEKKGQIFRKVALERLSSPEQLDQLMRVTNPQGWLALSALLLLILVALGWGIFGSIPTEASGGGILIRRGGVSELVAAGSGPVEEILVTVGDVVERGQVVARIRQESLIRQIEEIETRRSAEEQEYQELLIYAEEQRQLTKRNLAQERDNLERSIATFENELGILEERVVVQKDLLEDGLITQQTLLSTEQEINLTRDQIASQRLLINGLELRRLESEQQLQQQIDTRRGILRDLELQALELSGSLEENVNIVSPHSGRVLELVVDTGDVVSPGAPVLTMEVIAEELMAVIFVPAGLGKQVETGMEVRIVPSIVQPEEYGFMIGEVVWVSEFPATSRGMERLLANQELVSSLMELGPPIQIDVRLEQDPATPTGYRWSSSRGPELEISSGTLAAGSVIVRRVKPIVLVIPQLRKQLGI